MNDFLHTRSDQSSPIGIYTREEKEKIKEETKHFAPINREDMIKTGGSYELIGRFPYIVNYHELDEEAIVQVINLITSAAADSFDCGILLESQAMDELVASANSEFGCRLIESKIRDAIIRAYTNAITEDHQGKVLEVVIESLEDVSAYWRDPTEEEIVEDRIESESGFFDFETIWDDDSSDALGDIIGVI